MTNESKPFCFLSLGEDEGRFRVIQKQRPDEMVEVEHPESGRLLLVDGVFRGADEEELFNISLMPMCVRVLQQTSSTCSYISVGGVGPQLLSNESTCVHALQYLIGAAPGNVRVSFHCFLSNPKKPTDLLANVQQQVPDSLRWTNELGLDHNAQYLISSSLGSTLKTLRTVTASPAMRDLLPRLSFVLTIAIRGSNQSSPPSILRFVELRTEAAPLILNALSWQRGITSITDVSEQQENILMKSLITCQPCDTVIVTNVQHSDDSALIASLLSSAKVGSETLQRMDVRSKKFDKSPSKMSVSQTDWSHGGQVQQPPVFVLHKQQHQHQHQHQQQVDLQDSQHLSAARSSAGTGNVQVDVHLHLPDDLSSNTNQSEDRKARSQSTAATETPLPTQSIRKPSLISPTHSTPSTAMRIVLSEKDTQTPRVIDDEIANELQANQEKNTKLEEKIKEIENRMRLSESLNYEYEAEMAKHRSDLMKSHNELSILRVAGVEHGGRIQELQKLLAESRCRESDMEQEHSDGQQHFLILQSQYDSLYSEHKSDSFESLSLQYEVRSCEIQNRHSTSLLLILRQYLTEHHTLVQKKAAEKQNNFMSSNQRETSDLEEQLERVTRDLKFQVAKLNTTEQDTDAQIQNFQSKISLLETERDAKVKSSDKHFEDYKVLSDKYELVNDRQQATESTIISLEKRCFTAEGQVDVLKAERASHTTAITSLEKEIASLQSELRISGAAADRDKADFLQRTNELENDIASLKETNAELDAKTVDHQARNSTLEKQVVDLEAEIQTQKSDHHSETASEASSKGDTNQHILKLENEIETRDTVINNLKANLAKATKAKTEAERRERLTRRDSVPSSSPSGSSMIGGGDSNKEKEFTDEIQRLKSELHSLHHRQSLTAEDTAEDKRTLSVALSDARSEIGHLQSTLRTAEREVSTVRTEATALQNEYQQSVEHYEQSIQLVNEQWKQRETSWAQRHQLLDSQIQQSSEMLRFSDSEKQTLETRIHEAEVILTERTTDEKLVLSLRSQVNDLQKELEESRHHNASLLESERSDRSPVKGSARQIKQIQEEAKRREELLLGQIRSLVSSNDQPSSKALSPPLIRSKSPKGSKTNTNMARNWSEYTRSIIQSPAAVSPSSGEDEDSAEDEAAILKAQLAAVEAQNASLRKLKKEREKERTSKTGTPGRGQSPLRAGSGTRRLTSPQRQYAADRAKSRPGVRSPNSERKNKEDIRNKLASLTGQIKEGKFNRSKVDTQLSELLKAIE